MEQSSNDPLVENVAKISHTDVMDLLVLTILIYDYGKTIAYKSNDTIEEFISRSSENNVTTQGEGQEEEQDKDKEPSKPLIKQQAIERLLQNSPDGKIVDFISDPDTDLQAGITISETNKRITVIFRGSESTYDWYYDLKFIKTCIDKQKNVYVHGGFYKQLTHNKNHQRLTQKIKELLETYPDYYVYTTGHSLGGALCTLYGYMLSHEIEQNVSVISFASPRVGNKGWKKSFDAKSNLIHYRITNNNDIVTSFPTILYNHVGNNIRLERNNKASFLYDYSYRWWEYSIFKCYSIRDHSCEEYYKYLSTNTW
jgi:predicted lipase